MNAHTVKCLGSLSRTTHTASHGDMPAALSKQLDRNTDPQRMAIIYKQAIVAKWINACYRAAWASLSLLNDELNSAC